MANDTNLLISRLSPNEPGSHWATATIRGEMIGWDVSSQSCCRTARSFVVMPPPHNNPQPVRTFGDKLMVTRQRDNTNGARPCKPPEPLALVQPKRAVRGSPPSHLFGKWRCQLRRMKPCAGGGRLLAPWSQQLGSDGLRHLQLYALPWFSSDSVGAETQPYSSLGCPTVLGSYGARLSQDIGLDECEPDTA